MNIVRRIIGTLLIVAAGALVIVIDRQGGDAPVGAASGLVTLGGFPQAVAGNRISTSWFCPGAAAGDGLDGASVVLANPSDVAITASLSLLSDGPPENQNVSVPPRDRVSVDILRGRTIGVVVPVVEIIGGVGTVEQQLVYAAGDVTSQCVSQTSDTWYFADGFTAEGSTQRIVLINPYPESAVVNMSYTTAEGRRTPANLQGIILPAQSSKSLSMTDVGAANESRIAVEIIATTGQIVASRMQHFLGGGRLGYSTSVGVPEALGDWWFTSGRTGPQVTEQLVVFNPSERDAQLNVAFFGAGITNGATADAALSASVPSQSVDIPAGGTVYINTDNIADLPKGDHAMVVSTLNGSRVVVEHVLSQKTGGSFFTAMTNGVPSGLASSKWSIPSGLAKGARNALSILNTTAVDGTFTVSAVGPGGLIDLPNLVNVPLGAASLISLDVPEGVNEGEVVITATVPVVIQRRTTRGHGLVGFGIVSALPVREK
jgi:hypothetical protein